MIAALALLLGGVGLLGLRFGYFGRASESRPLATIAEGPMRPNEDGLEESDLAEIATAALRQDLMARRTRGATAEEADVRRAPAQPVELAKSEPALSPDEARKRASELFVAARQNRKLTQEDANRIVSFQRQMSEAELDESVRQFQDLLNSPNVDTSEL